MAIIDTPAKQSPGGSEYDSWLLKTNVQSTWLYDPLRLQTFNSPGPPYIKNNEFFTLRSKTTMGRFSGRSTNGRFTWSNWRLHGGITQTLIGPRFATSFQQGWVNSALASVNFTKPLVSLPNVIWELKEFPSMLRDLGRVLIGGYRLSDVPGAHLAWQFGWKPLVSDLSILLNLAGEIETTASRFAEIGKIKKAEGSIAEYVLNNSLTYTVGIAGLSCLTRYQTKEKVWYSAHWDVKSQLPNFYGGSALSAYGTALGFRQPMAALWNAIPWSFLIDYFLDVGTFLEATDGGLIEYKPAVLCIMRQTEETVLDTSLTMSGITGQEDVRFSRDATAKVRYVRDDPMARPAWTIHPIVDKMNILTSLATASALRRMSV